MFLLLNIAKVFSAFQDFREDSTYERSTDAEIADFLESRFNPISYDPVNVVQHELFENFSGNGDVEGENRQNADSLLDKVQSSDEVASGPILTKENKTFNSIPFDVSKNRNYPPSENNVINSNVTSPLDTSGYTSMSEIAHNNFFMPTQQPFLNHNPVQYESVNNCNPLSSTQVPQHSTYDENYHSFGNNVINSNVTSSLDTSRYTSMSEIEHNNFFMPTQQPFLNHNPVQYESVNNCNPLSSTQVPQHSTYGENYQVSANNAVPCINVTLSSDGARPSFSFESQHNTSLFLYENLSIHNPMHSSEICNHFDAANYHTVEAPYKAIIYNSTDKRDEYNDLFQDSSFKKFKEYIYRMEKYLKLSDQPTITEVDNVLHELYFDRYLKHSDNLVYFKMEDKVNEGILQVYNLVKNFSHETLQKLSSINSCQPSLENAEYEENLDGKDANIYKSFYETINQKLTVLRETCPRNIISYDSAALEILLLAGEIQQRTNKFKGLHMLYPRLKIKKTYRFSYLILYFLVQVMAKILNENILENNYLINVCYEFILCLQTHNCHKLLKFDVDKLKTSDEIWIALNTFDIIYVHKRESLYKLIAPNNFACRFSLENSPILLKHVIISLTIYFTYKIYDDSNVQADILKVEYFKITKAFIRKVFNISQKKRALLLNTCKALSHYINKKDFSLLDSLLN